MCARVPQRTDTQLADPDGIFAKVERYLTPAKAQRQLLLHSEQQFRNYNPDE
jgi:hypothetical protein